MRHVATNGPLAAIEGTESILLVEDDDAVREVMSRSLAARGYRVLTARNGEDALEVADDYDSPIHLVISDIVMPVMSGLQLFERLRGWYPSIRFLLISGYADPPIGRNALDDGRTRFLPKPFTIERLARESRSLLDVTSTRVGALLAHR
jgi:two-component system, cell cycle sensor histidine kinase and response regulator CckA